MDESRRKFYAVSFMAILLIVQFCFALPNVYPDDVSNPEKKLATISIVCVISLIVEVIIWKKYTGEFFSPYMVFFLVLYIFTCGQSIGWATGLDMGKKDLWSRVDHGLDRHLLTSGLCYSMLAVSCFHFGAVIRYSGTSPRKKKKVWSAECVENTYRKLGRLLLLIAIPAFAAKALQDVMAVSSGGYKEYYVVNDSRSAVMSIMSLLAGYYQPCLLLLLIGNRSNERKRRWIVCFMLLDIILSLYIGGRSDAVMSLLGIFLAYHLYVKPFSWKQSVVFGGAGFLSVIFLNGIASIRGTAGRGLTDLIDAFGKSPSSAVGDLVGELGWTITSICWTMDLVPSRYPFRYGMSYLVSLISWIPSTVFGGRTNSPVVKWGNLSNWLMNSLNMNYGPGYTTVAESYINFGWGGLIIMIIEGAVMCRLLASIHRKNTEEDLFGSTFQILIIMILMKSIVRSSFSVAMRSAVFVLIPLYCLLRFSLEKEEG